MNNENPIGIFDSGIGGVTVLREIIKLLPDEKYIYYSDSKNNPYGDKSNEQIISICDNIVRLFISKKCKAIVIACNTASAIASSYLRKKYKDIPIIAIEPAYKMVYDFAYDNPTLVMATKGTIESEKFNLLLKKYDNHKTILCECIGLADIIEEGKDEKIHKYLEKNIGIYKGKVKNVVLGCTHYPLIQNQINDVLGGNIIFFNGASRLAVHLKEVLNHKKILNICKNEKNNKVIFFDSQNSDVKRERFFRILQE